MHDAGCGTREVSSSGRSTLTPSRLDTIAAGTIDYKSGSTTTYSSSSSHVRLNISEDPLLVILVYNLLLLTTLLSISFIHQVWRTLPQTYHCLHDINPDDQAHCETMPVYQKAHRVERLERRKNKTVRYQADRWISKIPGTIVQ